MAPPGETDAPSCIVGIPQVENVMTPPRGDKDTAKLQAYASVMSTWVSDGPWVVMILVLAPIAVPMLALASRLISVPLRPIQVWQSLPKVRLVLCSLFLMAELTLLVLTCPFTAQIWFWSLLEFSTVVNFAVYLLDPRALHVTSALDALCLPLRPFVAAPCVIIGLLRDVPSAHVVAFAAASLGISIETLVFAASDGSHVSAARAFDADQAQAAATRRLAWPRMAIALFIAITGVYNQMFLHSWPAGVWNAKQVFAPGINGLLATHRNSVYSITTDMSKKRCDNTTRSGKLIFAVSVAIKPEPSIEEGLPLVVFECLAKRNHSFVPFLLAPSSSDESFETAFAYNASIALVDRQKSLLFSVSIQGENCSDVINYDFNATQTYAAVPPAAYIQYLQITSSVPTLGVLQLALACKYLVQHTMLSVLVLFCALQNWRLWLCFDGILAHGLYIADRKTAALIDLAFGDNLKVWFQLRQSVQTACVHCTSFTTIFLKGALVQCSATMLAILFYCITGSAPLPTYFLLLMGLIGSLSTLAMLWPLAAALDIQRKHGQTLSTQLLELHFRCLDKTIIPDHADACIALFESIMENVERYEHRMTFFGFAITMPRLATMGAALPSLVSFIAFHVVPSTWASFNAFSVMENATYAAAINPANNTYSG
ncbi:hypothetical protein SDRG_12227 [Saprolegnia diclina VS20]|uniref:Uncharacterized protein n=1 Tax=Saprolegnia diclina (strain VS20) TaxID=1156394 RepID=T0Q910_SAPDV|nr:hypothetical protein SDRG_12227 [Saprolegnia diclina VS20]EQC29945.1 hypothetical protein SDRG_12227 [Saprolegnia diclina VS20]|eukprot:XP_008616512.1 hypothetical protein SDRG_12227 [Saprolegnia diclina VS20]